MSITSYTICNLTERILTALPTGAVYYSYTFVVQKDTQIEIKTFLEKRIDFKKQTDVSVLSHNEYDWITYSGMKESIHYVSVSDKVYNDPEFRGIMLEYLM